MNDADRPALQAAAWLDAHAPKPAATPPNPAQAAWTQPAPQANEMLGQIVDQHAAGMNDALDLPGSVGTLGDTENTLAPLDKLPDVAKRALTSSPAQTLADIVGSALRPLSNLVPDYGDEGPYDAGNFQTRVIREQAAGNDELTNALAAAGKKYSPGFDPGAAVDAAVALRHPLTQYTPGEQQHDADFQSKMNAWEAQQKRDAQDFRARLAKTYGNPVPVE